MKYILALISFFLCNIIQAQEFSILTCDRGEEIYSTFGHSAIRYTDTSQGIDVVYNYGLFDFGDPNFIPKFCNGLLDYKVGKEEFGNFISQYNYQGREVKEQMLNLSDSQKTKLHNFLEWNILPENQYYRYNFLYNNCATKIIDIIQEQCDGIKILHEYDNNSTFRKLIHHYAANSVPYIDWGMDLGIGKYTDTLITKRDYCFLPDYVYKTLSTSLNLKTGSNLTEKSTLILENQVDKKQKPFIYKPIFLALIILFMSFYAKFKGGKFKKYFFSTLFIIAGIGGCVLFYLWFFTEHSVTKANWNLGWLNPLSLIYGVMYLIGRKSDLLKKVLSLSILLTLLFSLFGVQKFHIASVIMMIALLISHGSVIIKGTTKYKKWK